SLHRHLLPSSRSASYVTSSLAQFLSSLSTPTSPTELHTLSLHDALPICAGTRRTRNGHCPPATPGAAPTPRPRASALPGRAARKRAAPRRSARSPRRTPPAPRALRGTVRGRTRQKLPPPTSHSARTPARAPKKPA